VGRIEAGQIDYVRKLPPTDKSVLQVDTLIVGNGCASHSATQGLMAAVAEVFPAFVRHNRGQPAATGIPLTPIAKAFFDDEGPDLLGTYAPWAVDILPLPTWLQVFVALSVLFSGMRVAHRFRLWRIDANRVKIERDLHKLIPSGLTADDVAAAPLDPAHRDAEVQARFDLVEARLAALAARSRQQSLSTLVPMGEEMQYRFQESLIGDLLRAIRAYRQRLSRSWPAP